MSNTARVAAIVAKFQSTLLTISDEEIKVNRERYWKALREGCTDAEIEELEARDLTEPTLIATLEAAYEAQDPTDRTGRWWRKPKCVHKTGVTSSAHRRHERTNPQQHHPDRRGCGPGEYWWPSGPSSREEPLS